MNNEIADAVQNVAATAGGRLKLSMPEIVPPEGIFYVGTGEKREKYTLRWAGRVRIGFHDYMWIDQHHHDNLDHLSADPANAAKKALSLTGNETVYFQPFELHPRSAVPRVTLPTKPAGDYRVSLGLHKGKKLSEVADADPDYVVWLSENAWNIDLRKAAEELIQGSEILTKFQQNGWDIDQTLNFGKYGQLTLPEVAVRDLSYVYWLAENARERGLRAVCEGYVGPQNLPLEEVDVSAVLESANLAVAHEVDDRWWVRGSTYPIRSLLSFLGGTYSYDEKCYWFPESPIPNIVLSIVDPDDLSRAHPDKIDPDGAHERELARKAREEFDGFPDHQLSPEGYAQLVSPGTVRLLERGLEFGIPEDVIREQIEDIGKIVHAYERGEGLSLLASAAGSGKTFVLGGAVRELYLRDQEIEFNYVTLRKTLIKQIQSDLKDYGIVDQINFHTYNGIGKQVPMLGEKAISIFDEGHLAKNPESKAGMSFKTMTAASIHSVVASATPYEDPSEMEYLEPTGLFEPHNFRTFALAYGAQPTRVVTPNTYGGTRVKEQIGWRFSKESESAAKAAREYICKRGVFTQRIKRLPKGLVHSKFHAVDIDPSWLDLHAQVIEAFDNALTFAPAVCASEDMILAQRRNVEKRLLEASKLDAAIQQARQAVTDGRQAVIFVETKSDRLLGSEESFDHLYWQFETWRNMPFEIREYPPPVTRMQVALAYGYEAAGLKTRLPSVVDTLVNGFGRDATAVYTGAKKFNTSSVTDASADKELASWKSGDRAFLIATMAKGGTGLSLHPTKKNNPRTQIGINLPWKAYGVDQVIGRCARYGMQSEVDIDWLFASGIDVEREIASKVGARMAGMGSLVSGLVTDAAQGLMDWDMEESLELQETRQSPKNSDIDTNEPVSSPSYQEMQESLFGF